MKKYQSLCFFLFLLTIACSEPEAPPQESSGAGDHPPNIVLIVSDDQGYSDLGCYGAEDVQTPVLDQLARDGVRLTDFHVAGCVCTPSRAAMLTGRYPQRNGTYELIRNDRADDGHLYQAVDYSVSQERIIGTDLREIFLSELLREAGYTNGIFGKWDMGQLQRFLPLQRGFHRFYGHVNTGIDYFTHERYGVPSMYEDNAPTTEDKGTYATDLFEREALAFLAENIEQPFFLYLPFNAPHYGSNRHKEDSRYPVQATAEYLEKYPEAFAKGAFRRQGHMAAITDMDDAIGNILEFIATAGKADNTLVIFLSDNGGGAATENQPLRGKKGTFYEGGSGCPASLSGRQRYPGTG